MGAGRGGVGRGERLSLFLPVDTASFLLDWTDIQSEKCKNNKTVRSEVSTCSSSQKLGHGPCSLSRDRELIKSCYSPATLKSSFPPIPKHKTTLSYC